MTANRKIIRPKALFDPSFHAYSQGISVGGLLFVSGQMAFLKDEKTGKRRLVGAGDITLQAKQVFKNIGEVLAEAGGSFEDITSMTVYLKDIGDLEKFCKVRKEIFGPNPPTSTAVQVSAFADPGGLVEVNAIAILPKTD